MADVNEVLLLIKGSTKPFDVFVFDQNDQPENLAVFDQATLVLRESDAGANLLLRRTADGNLSINTTASKLTATLSQGEADGLKAGGELVAMVSLRETLTQKWVDLDRIRVKVLNSFAVHTP